MPAPRRVHIEDVLNRPGTYYNPVTDVLLVVDDAAALDPDLFEADAEADEWVIVADDVPVDETARDQLIERFESRYHEGASGAVHADADDEDEPDVLPEADEDPDDF